MADAAAALAAQQPPYEAAEQTKADDEQMNDSDEVLVPPMKLDPALVGLPLRFEHEHKVNWLDAQSMDHTNGLRLLVADESPVVTIYEGFI